MTELLDRAIAEVKKLPTVRQDAIALLIFEEIEDEVRWEKAFDLTRDALAKLGAEAMAEYQAGKTEELDPETL